MLIEYVVFFGLLTAAVFVFILRKEPEPILDPITAQRVKCESVIERKLYDALVYNGYAVTTQVKCGPYRIDLALIGPRIAIEADGKAFHSSPAQKAHDRKKNAYLRKNGWRVLRFSGRQINGQMSQVIQKISKEVSKT
jgi:very-short-patch-repair endonuclease